MSVELAPGVVVAGRYRLEHLLGQGGMGVVWAATHELTKRSVALKFLLSSAALVPELRRRFMREARAVSAIVHPNVVTVHDVFELDDGTPVMVMDRLTGETLGQKLSREGALGLAGAADILAQVVSAVGTAHAAGVVHRDLKPDNVFLGRAEGGVPEVKVLDFGIAKLVGTGPTASTGKLTATGAILGTPCYMSPEQTFGEADIDHRTDVWSLGVMLYECLAGARPIEGDTMGQVVKQLVRGSITPIAALAPSLPLDVTSLVDRMLARERSARPNDLREVLEILSRHATVPAPRFGTVRPEAPSVPANGPVQVVVGQRGTDPSARTLDGGGPGPDTSEPHLITNGVSPAPKARPWLFVAALLGAGAAAYFATGSGNSTSSVVAPGGASEKSPASPPLPPPRPDEATPAAASGASASASASASSRPGAAGSGPVRRGEDGLASRPDAGRGP